MNCSMPAATCCARRSRSPPVMAVTPPRPSSPQPRRTRASRPRKLARDAGALSALPLAVRWPILLHTHAGELAQGAALIAEAQAVAGATGSQLGPHGDLGVAAWRGHEAEATELIQATMDRMTSRGEGRGVTRPYAAALLDKGLGRPHKALTAP